MSYHDNTTLQENHCRSQAILYRKNTSCDVQEVYSTTTNTKTNKQAIAKSPYNHSKLFQELLLSLHLNDLSVRLESGNAAYEKKGQLQLRHLHMIQIIPRQPGESRSTLCKEFSLDQCVQGDLLTSSSELIELNLLFITAIFILIF